MSVARSAGGEPEEILVVSRDISALKERERALAAAEQRWRAAFKAAPLGVAEMALDGRFLNVNAAFCELLGYSEEQLRAMTPADISHPDDTEDANRAIATPAETTRVERRYVHADGRIVTCLVNGVSVGDGFGSRERLLAYFDDISERKLNDQVLADERRRLIDAQTVGRIGSWELDVATSTVIWSDTLFEMRGMEPGSVAGDHTRAMSRIHEDDREMVDAGIRACIATGAAMHTRYRVVRADDGTLTWNDSRAEALYENGRVQRVSGTVVDVTEQVVAQRALEESETLLRVAFDAAPIAIALISCEHRYQRVNSAMCEMTGYREDELLGMGPADISHPDDTATERAAMAQLLSGELSTFRFEKRYRTAGGAEAWATKSLSLVRRQDGSPRHFIAQVQDITERKAYERVLVEERRRLHEAQSVGRVGSWERDLESGVSTWSDMLLELFGLDREPLDEFQRVLDCIHSEDREMVASAVGACTITGEPMRIRYRAARANDGAHRWFDGLGEALCEDGRVCRVVGTVIDVTEQVLAEQALLDSEMRFRLAFDTAPVAMAMIGLQGESSELLRVNPAMCLLTGRTEGELRALDFMAISHPDDGPRNSAMLAELRSGQADVESGERRFCRPDGTTVWGELAVSVVAPTNGNPAYGICLIEDITARKRAEAALVHEALHDALTGLPNRRLLHDRLDHALAASTRSHAAVGLLFLDLDGFKQVNDSAGHAAGDALLVEVADRLRQSLRAGDTVARLGGDEFAVVCPGVADIATLSVAADRVLVSMAEPFHLVTGTHHVSASIGLAISTMSNGAEQMLADADDAMYSAKKAGKNRVAAPHFEEPARATRSARLLPEPHVAVNDCRLLTLDQPGVELATGVTVSVPTLIRWQHPVLGLLPPSASSTSSGTARS